MALNTSLLSKILKVRLFVIKLSLNTCDEAFFFGFSFVEGHLWKAQWKEKPNDEGHKKLTMNS